MEVWNSELTVSFSILKRSLHCLLDCVASNFKFPVMLIIVPLCVMCPFSLFVFKISLYLLFLGCGWLEIFLSLLNLGKTKRLSLASGI